MKQLELFGAWMRRLCRARPVGAEERPERRRGSAAAELRDRARAILLRIGCAELAGRIDVRWNSRMRSTAGVAYTASALVVLNPRLCAFGDEEIERTLKHELAHLVAQHRAGRRRIQPHGLEWRKACLDLELPDEKRCHDLALPKRRVTRRHRYKCPHCGVEVRRVKPFRRRSACLLCCRAHARGRYDDRFRFVKLASPPAEVATASQDGKTQDGGV